MGLGEVVNVGGCARSTGTIEPCLMALPPPRAPVLAKNLCSGNTLLAIEDCFREAFSVQEMCPQSLDLPHLEIFPVNGGRYYCIICCLYEMVASQKAPEEESIMYCLPNIIVLAAVDLVDERKGKQRSGDYRGSTPC